ncbi:hypothetical protein ABW21_db0207765 [Orbilia brochopaga]|nr:hypothetical protein ABW21_db0207765 [Drechslerella brochopaga]
MRLQRRLLPGIVLLSAQCGAVTIPLHSNNNNTATSLSSTNSTLPPQIQEALATVQKAQLDAAVRAQERYENPAPNIYQLRPPSQLPHSRVQAVDDRVAKAAAAVAEYEAKTNPAPPLNLTVDGTTHVLGKRDGGSFWMESIAHSGFVPIGGAPDYKVFRNVRDFGAVGDGATDDTAAINKAISSGNRCGQDCGSSTTAPALVYFPAGTYLVSSPIISYYNTQLVGNAVNRPVIRAAGSFVGLGVISSDVYIPGASGAEWYINQNNFLRQIRNFNIDLRQVPNAMPSMDGVPPAGIHWQVAQATSIQNVRIIMSSGPDTTHVGIYMENGSGGFMSDVTFNGGKIGAYLGNQQFTIRKFSFQGCQTAVHMLWDWAFTMKSFEINNCQVGFNVTANAGGRGAAQGQGVGSLTILDSSISNTPVGIKTFGQITGNSSSIFLENMKLSNVNTAIMSDGQVVVPGGTTTIPSWASGTMYNDNNFNKFAQGVQTQTGGAIPVVLDAPKELVGATGWFERSKPQYENVPVSQFWDVKARYGAKGNAHNDDTAAINRALADAAGAGAIVYFPYGIYIVTDTIFVPPGSRVVGEVWSQIMASGAKFSDINNPHVVVRVGNVGDRGSVELQDIMVTVRGATAGAVLMEWNIHEDKQGSAAMWDCHFRIGGAVGSMLQTGDCPKGATTVDPKCIAGSLLMHQTEKSSGYFENVWAWVADHDMDKVSQDQINVYVGRGWLIESQGPSWLYGTASEHCVLYQYQMHKASNLFLGMIQTEAPYYQSSPGAPAPFDPSILSKRQTKVSFPNDPTFKHCAPGDKACAVAWAVRVYGSVGVHLYGAGLYSWFQHYSQDCLHSDNCQANLLDMDDSTSTLTRVHNLVTIGSENMMDASYAGSIPATNYKNGFASSLMGWVAATPVKQLAKKRRAAEDRVVVEIPDGIADDRTRRFFHCTPEQQKIIKRALQSAFKVIYNTMNIGQGYEVRAIGNDDPAVAYLGKTWETYFGDYETGASEWTNAYTHYGKALGISPKQAKDFAKRRGQEGYRFPWNARGDWSFPINFWCPQDDKPDTHTYTYFNPGSGKYEQQDTVCINKRFPGQIPGARAWSFRTERTKRPLTDSLMEVCPVWFNDESFPYLEDIEKSFAKNENKAIWLRSKPGTFIHEIMHFRNVKHSAAIKDQCVDFAKGKIPEEKLDGSWKNCPDQGSRNGYGPKFCADLAAFRPDLAEVNADSYQWHAMSIYMNLYSPDYKADPYLKRDELDTPDDVGPEGPDPNSEIKCAGEDADEQFHSDCLAAVEYSWSELNAGESISTDAIQGSYEVATHGSCSIQFTPSPGVSCFWLKTDLKDAAKDLNTACQRPGKYELNTDDDLGRQCSGIIEAKKPTQSNKVYIIGDSVYSYNAKKSKWTGEHKWLSFQENKDPSSDDNVKLNWCSVSANMHRQGTELPETQILGQWPTGSVGSVEPYPNEQCEYKNKDGVSYNDSGPGDEVGSLDCGVREHSGKCKKVNNKDIWPGYYQCDSMDAGKKHMQFIYAVCEG